MLVKARVEAIIEQEGVFRDPKRTGCFVAHGPCGQFAEAGVWSSWHPFR
jgi:hypothetical protein